MSYGQELTPSTILFGGSFDPPHEGHFNCITAARSLFPKAEIVVVPACRPAAVAGLEKQPSASVAQRLNMAELGFCGRGVSNITISDFEARSAEPLHTWQTVTHWLSKLDSRSRIGVLIGTDQFENFDKWRKPNSILSVSDLIVCHRDETDIFAIGARVLERMGLNFRRNNLGFLVDGEFRCQIYLLNDDVVEASSTDVRKDIYSTPLYEGVKQFILNNNLYGTR